MGSTRFGFRRRGVSVVLALVAPMAVSGCKETVSGDYLDTEGIAMVADVRAFSDTKAEVDIEFLVGGDESNTYVDLSDDELVIKGGDQSKTVSQSAVGEYSASFSSGEAGTEYRIELDREDPNRADAFDNVGTLPEAFTIGIEPGGEVSRQEMLTVTWEPSGSDDDMRIDLDGDCIFFTFKSGEADDGVFAIEANDLIFGGDPADDDKGECEVEVTVTRTRKGETDSIFDAESKLRLHQVRSTTYRSLP
ncbi:MAG: hypothetical protein OEZ06_26415 [Myxococcales bacterium]|nr:hypothetical protein [Myxococcales bacterium]